MCRYATRNGYGGGGPGSTAGGGDNGSPSTLPSNWTLLPGVLNAVGYRSHAAGKWHLGFPTVEYTPTGRGFETWIGYLGGAEDHWDHSTNHGGCPGTDFWEGTARAQGPANNSAYYPQYSTYIFGDRHVATIEAHDPTEPLFIYAPFQNAHVPHQVPKRFFKLFESKNHGCNWTATKEGRQAFDCKANPRFPHSPASKDCGCNRLLVGAMMAALDEAISNMTAALRRKGMWENTVLVVMGDNGGPVNNGHDNGPFRGGKLNWWEGGVRPFAFISSPLLRDSPFRGGWYNDSVHETDWFATFAALARGPLTLI